MRGDRQKTQMAIAGRPILDTPNFPDSVFLVLDPSTLPTNTDAATHSRDSTNFEAFEAPQLIIKQSWIHAEGRFRAAWVKAESCKGVICVQSYVSVHAGTEDEGVLESACLVYNSNFALYWLYMTNHWLATFVAKATVSDLLLLPLPPLESPQLDSLGYFDYEAVDELVRQSLGLEDTDWALISDSLPSPCRTSNAFQTRPARSRLAGGTATTNWCGTVNSSFASWPPPSAPTTTSPRRYSVKKPLSACPFASSHTDLH